MVETDDFTCPRKKQNKTNEVVNFEKKRKRPVCMLREPRQADVFITTLFAVVLSDSSLFVQ